MIFISDIIDDRYKVTDSDSGMTLEMTKEEIAGLSQHGAIQGYQEVPYKGKVLDDVFLPSFNLYNAADYDYLAVPSKYTQGVPSYRDIPVQFWTVYDLRTHEELADKAFIVEVRSSIDVTLATQKGANGVQQYKVCSSGNTLFVSGRRLDCCGIARNSYETFTNYGVATGYVKPTCISTLSLLRDSNIIDLWAIFCTFINYCVENNVSDNINDFLYPDGNCADRLLPIMRDSGLFSYDFDFSADSFTLVYSRFWSLLKHNLKRKCSSTNICDYETVSSEEFINYYMMGSTQRAEIYYIRDMGIFVASDVCLIIDVLLKAVKSFGSTGGLSNDYPIDTVFRKYYANTDITVEDVALDVLNSVTCSKLFFFEYLRYTKLHRFICSLYAASNVSANNYISWCSCYNLWFAYSAPEVILDFKQVIKDGVPDIELIIGNIRAYGSRSAVCEEVSTCSFKKTYLSTKIKERVQAWASHAVSSSSKYLRSESGVGTIQSILNNPALKDAVISGESFFDVVFTFITRYGVIQFDVDNYRRFLGYGLENTALKSSLARAKLSGSSAVLVTDTGIATEVRLPERSLNGVYNIVFPKNVKSLSEDVLYDVLAKSWARTDRRDDNIVVRFTSDLTSVKFKMASLVNHHSGATVIDVYYPKFEDKKAFGDLLYYFGHSIHQCYFHPQDEDAFIDTLYTGLIRAGVSRASRLEHGFVFNIEVLNGNEIAKYQSNLPRRFDYHLGNRLPDDMGVDSEEIVVRSKMHFLDHSEITFTKQMFYTLMSKFYTYFDSGISAFESKPKLVKSAFNGNTRDILNYGLLFGFANNQSRFLLLTVEKIFSTSSDVLSSFYLDDLKLYNVDSSSFSSKHVSIFAGTSLHDIFQRYCLLSHIYDLAILQLGERTVWEVLKQTGMFSLFPRFYNQALRLKKFVDCMDWDDIVTHDGSVYVDRAKEIIFNNFDKYFESN